MENARQGKKQPGNRTYFVLVVSIGNEIWQREHYTPHQDMEYKIRISELKDFHHWPNGGL